MIRTFTIVENRSENGNVEYSVNGDMPIDEVARALVVIAFNAQKPEKKEVMTEPAGPDQPE
jgi:hypothetical protein